MFDSAILDVAVGLAFIFLMVSLLVSAAAEALSGWLKWRSQHLWDGLEQLLQSKDARNELYSHPLIKGLARVNANAPAWNDGRDGPSYIPSRTFALAVIDVLREPHRFVDELSGRLQSIVEGANHDPSKVFDSLEQLVAATSTAAVPDSVKLQLRDLWARLNPAPDRAVIDALTRQVRDVLEKLPQEDRASLGDTVPQWLESANAATTYAALRVELTESIRKIPFRGATAPAEQVRTALGTVVQEFAHGSPEEAAREIQAFVNQQTSRWLQDAKDSFKGTVAALSPLMHDAADDVDRFRENIEIWFNDGMDRVSGWYKRHIMYVQGGLALVLAAVMNIDALQITRTLWREPTLRQSLVAKAEGFVANPPPALQELPAETVAQPPAASGKDVTVRLSAVRISPGQPATVRVVLPEPATDQESIVAETQAPHLLLGDTPDNVSSTRVEKKLAAGAVDATIYVASKPVTTDSRESFTITARKQQAVSEVIAAARADQHFTDLQREIGTLGLPIGWSCPTDTAPADETRTNIGGPFWCAGATPVGKSGGTWSSFSWWAAIGLKNVLAMVIGWLITAAATSMGAPFWFDTLKRIVSIRSSGKAPEERPLSPKQVPQPREPGQRPREADLMNALRR